MAMTETAAARSPRNLTFKESREAESPVKKRAGIVPRPKANIVRNPPMRLGMVAALMIMAQESMQGKKPVRNPRAIFDAARRDRRREESRAGNKRPGGRGQACRGEGQGKDSHEHQTQQDHQDAPGYSQAGAQTRKELVEAGKMGDSGSQCAEQAVCKNAPEMERKMMGKTVPPKGRYSGAL